MLVSFCLYRGLTFCLLLSLLISSVFPFSVSPSPSFTAVSPFLSLPPSLSLSLSLFLSLSLSLSLSLPLSIYFSHSFLPLPLSHLPPSLSAFFLYQYVLFSLPLSFYLPPFHSATLSFSLALLYLSPIASPFSPKAFTYFPNVLPLLCLTVLTTRTRGAHSIEISVLHRDTHTDWK